MSAFLLDTHVVLWWLFGDQRLSYRSRTLIADSNNQLLMSAASGWEIATKHRIGKLERAGRILETLPQLLGRSGIETLDIDLEDALLAGATEHDHRDPFDRMIAAQGIRRELAIVTNDAAIGSLGATTLW